MTINSPKLNSLCPDTHLLIKRRVLVCKDNPKPVGRPHTFPVQTSPPALHNLHSEKRQVQTLSRKLFASHLPAEDYLLKKFADNSADKTGKSFLQGKHNHGFASTAQQKQELSSTEEPVTWSSSSPSDPIVPKTGPG